MDDTKAESKNAWDDDWDEEPIQLAKSQAQQLLESNDREEKCLPIQDESNQEDSNEAPMQEICPSVEQTNQVSPEFANDLSNMLTALENEQNDKDLIINTNIELEDNAWEEDDWDEEPIQLNLQKDPLPESSTPSETSSQLKDDLTDQTFAASKNTHKEVLQVEQISVTDDDNSCIFSHAELSSPPDNAVLLENCNAPSQTPEATENVSHALADLQQQQQIDSWGDDWDDRESLGQSDDVVQSGQSLGEFTSELLGNPPTVLSKVNPSVDTNDPEPSRNKVLDLSNNCETENSWSDELNVETTQPALPFEQTEQKAIKRHKTTKGNTATWEAILTLFDVCLESGRIKVPQKRNYSHLNFARPLPANIVDDPSQFTLPPLPAPLEKMTQVQLKTFVPRMLECATGLRKSSLSESAPRPSWWPIDLIIAAINSDIRSDAAKAKDVSQTDALRQIVIDCYEFHQRIDLLLDALEDFLNDLGSIGGNNSLWRIDPQSKAELIKEEFKPRRQGQKKGCIVNSDANRNVASRYSLLQLLVLNAFASSSSLFIHQLHLFFPQFNS